MAACKRHLAYAAGFSALLNLLYLAPTLYMLQVYDRVVPSRSGTTLLFLSLVLLFSLEFIMINLVVDLLYFVVDPRLRVGKAGGH